MLKFLYKSRWIAALILIILYYNRRRKIKAQLIDDRIVLIDDIHHSKGHAIYPFGKGSLSRGKATWFKRQMENKPASFGEKKRWIEARPDRDYEVTILSKEEALYLVKKNLLIIKDGWFSISNRLLESWETDRYKVYEYYTSKGWVVKCGSKLGLDFTLYQDNPENVHSDFGVAVSKSATLSTDWIIPRVRVCNSVKKSLIVCFVQENHVIERVFKRWLPEQNR